MTQLRLKGMKGGGGTGMFVYVKASYGRLKSFLSREIGSILFQYYLNELPGWTASTYSFSET